MVRKLQTSVVALAIVFGVALVAEAQSGQLRGKVIDTEGKPVPGAAILIEFADGVNRKYNVKTDRRGEFIQIGLQPGNYNVTATVDKLGTVTLPARVTLARPAEVEFNFAAAAAAAGGADPAAAAKAAALKKAFEEGVAATQAKNYDLAIQKFEEAAAAVPNCFDCYYNIGFAYTQKKDVKAAEAAWLKAVELKGDYADALNALATLYNNQKRFDEASAMSVKAAEAGGVLGGGNADAIYNQGIILWNQGKIPEAKVKFEEAIEANASHPEAHFQLGMALLNEGNVPLAVTSFEKYLELAPDGQFSAQAKGMLAQLKKGASGA
ncbi:MAG TPA: tetratricopeptide repeat protein [Vicinamibacterales bacterium]|nr:tetratricopeptide repeat protein [Vicinamibacterales bacterium]